MSLVFSLSDDVARIIHEFEKERAEMRITVHLLKLVKEPRIELRQFCYETQMLISGLLQYFRASCIFSTLPFFDTARNESHGIIMHPSETEIFPRLRTADDSRYCIAFFEFEIRVRRTRAFTYEQWYIAHDSPPFYQRRLYHERLRNEKLEP